MDILDTAQDGIIVPKDKMVDATRPKNTGLVPRGRGNTMHIFITVLIVIGYFALVLAVFSVLLKVVFRVPREVVRKFQHIGFAASVFIFTERCDTWWQAVLVIVIFGATIFFGIWLMERSRFYQRFFVDRDSSGGELKKSALIAMGVFALLFTLFGGVLPRADNEIIIVAVMSWGVGDALAALFGKYLGKRKLNSPGVDPEKTWVGSVSMSLGVFVAVMIMLLVFAGEPWWAALVSAAIISIVSTTIEAYSKKGLDTLGIPLGVAFTLYGLRWFWILVLGG